MAYLLWLLIISALFLVAERAVPWRRGQPAFRRGWLRDLGFLALNGHLLSLVTAGISGAIALVGAQAMRSAGVSVEGSPVATWPLPVQFVVFLVVADFLQWCIHNLLHRVPWLWTFHQVHHAITTMDWIGNWRFHWAEILVYRALQWLPLTLLNVSPEAIAAVAIVTTFWGELNHSNLDIGFGRLGWVLNSPRMHLWHHDRSVEGGVAKNFGIVFSLWDHLFRTAYWPRDRSPERLGYAGIEAMPESLAGELLWPLTRRAGAVDSESAR
ncbi:MAG: sterol desaturase family protein [Candidatus Eisenbacteria bacterium]|nr:sterol desaturase family protein [Candidatus Eisenbacteria bacterium]